MVDLVIGTSGGNKSVTAAHIGTSGGTKQATEGWVGTASGNKQFLTTAFAGVVHTYDSGSGNEVVPVGATSLTLELWAGGAGGGRTTNAGGGGEKRTITRAVLSSEWGTNLAYVIGAGGAGRTAGSAGYGSDGADSTVTGTLNGTSLSVTAKKGLAAGNGGSGGSGGTGNNGGNGGNDTGGDSIPPDVGVGYGGDGGGTGGGAGGVNIWDWYSAESHTTVVEAGPSDGATPGGGGGMGEWTAGAKLPGQSGGSGRAKFTWS
jgi:hypothetical protein